MDDQPSKPKRKKNIPIPINVPVVNYDKEVLDDFVVPTSYVRFQNLPQENDEKYSKVELDLEVEDMEWLRSHPKYGEIGDPRYQLSLETFGKMLDLLEKASALINPSVITFVSR